MSTHANRGGTFARTKVFAHDLFSWLGAKVLVVHFGIVDCWLRDGRQQLTSPEDFQAAVRDLVSNQATMGPDVLLIVIGILPTNKKMLAKEPKQNEAIAQFNQILREELDGQSAVFLDVEKTYADRLDDLLHLDGHHLSKTGHRVYAEGLSNIILTGFDLTGRAGRAQPDIKALQERVRASIDAKQFDEALADVSETLGPNKDEALGSALVGEIEFARGAFDVAFRYLSSAAKHFPRDVKLWNLTALSAFRVLPSADALSFLAHAHAINPASTSIAFRLMTVLCKEDLYPQALVTLMFSIAAMPIYLLMMLAHALRSSASRR